MSKIPSKEVLTVCDSTIMEEALAENLHREWRTRVIQLGLKDRFEPDWSRLSEAERKPWRAVAKEAMELL